MKITNSIKQCQDVNISVVRKLISSLTSMLYIFTFTAEQVLLMIHPT